MGKLGICFIAFVLAAVPLHAAGPQQSPDFCYQQSNLTFFLQVVQLVEAGRNQEHGCWELRLRLRGGPANPQGHAMICGGNACSPHLDLHEGIFWREDSRKNENIESIIRIENGSCTDVSFCIVAHDDSETLLVDFIALFEESYFVPPMTYRPRWSHGVIDLSSFDGTKSHCQDGDPRGAICL